MGLDCFQQLLKIVQNAIYHAVNHFCQAIMDWHSFRKFLIDFPNLCMRISFLQTFQNVLVSLIVEQIFDFNKVVTLIACMAKKTFIRVAKFDRQVVSEKMDEK